MSGDFAREVVMVPGEMPSAPSPPAARSVPTPPPPAELVSIVKEAADAAEQVTAAVPAEACSPPHPVPAAPREDSPAVAKLRRTYLRLGTDLEAARAELPTLAAAVQTARSIARERAVVEVIEP